MVVYGFRNGYSPKAWNPALIRQAAEPMAGKGPAVPLWLACRRNTLSRWRRPIAGGVLRRDRSAWNLIRCVRAERLWPQNRAVP
ncbi:protein of unknown function [Methylacidimicrobium sp. AP8]|nr:protein of unknown function [Methylacidimicrobium sp. AP8]